MRADRSARTRATIGAMTTRRGAAADPRPTPTPVQRSSRPCQGPSRGRPQPGRLATHRPIERGRGMPLIVRSRAVARDRRAGRGRAVRRAPAASGPWPASLGTTLTGFVDDVTATPSPIPSVPVVERRPVAGSARRAVHELAAGRPRGHGPRGDGRRHDHRIRVYLALHDQTATAIMEVPIGPTAKTVVPVELDQGDQRLHGLDRGRQHRVGVVGDRPLRPRQCEAEGDDHLAQGQRDRQRQDRRPSRARSRPARRSRPQRDERGHERRTAAPDGTFTLTLPITTGQNHDHHRCDRSGRERQDDRPDRPPRLGQADGLALGVGLPDLAQGAARGDPAHRHGDRPGRQPAQGCGRDLHPEHPGHPDGHARTARPVRTGVRRAQTTIPKGRDPRPGQRHGARLERRVRVHAGLHGHHRRQVARPLAPTRRFDSGATRSYHPRHADVAMSTLRDTTGRDGPVLGLPSIQHRLPDLSAFPSLGRRERRVLRARPSTRAARRRRDPGVLGGRPVLDGAHHPGGARPAGGDRRGARPADRVRRGHGRSARRAGPAGTTDATGIGAPEPSLPMAPDEPRWSLWEDPTV